MPVQCSMCSSNYIFSSDSTQNMLGCIRPLYVENEDDIEGNLSREIKTCVKVAFHKKPTGLIKTKASWPRYQLGTILLQVIYIPSKVNGPKLFFAAKSGCSSIE